MIDQTLLEILCRVDTPTVCNAIEVAQGRRGFANFTRSTMVATDPGTALVGFAMTAQIAALAPSQDPPDAVRARRMAYYRAMYDAPKPSVAVVEDLDWPACIGAYWGEINTTVHKGFGMSGALTNGVVRDLGDLPDGFPVVAGSIGPSHGYVHVRSINQPVRVLGLLVNPGDLVHADRHGAVVVPTEAIPALGTAIDKLLASEQVILAPARKGFSDFSEFESAWTEFERARV